MIDFLSQYGLFLAKTLTLIIGIIVTLSAIFAIAKSKEEDGTLIITHINEKVDDIRDSLQSETLSKEHWKKWSKEQKKALKDLKKINKDQGASRLFVVRFDGDIRASEVTGLREIITAIVEVANPKDEVLVILESSGGFVHGYGLAASQLQRIRARDLTLTVSIDKLAASGGYMMACVANKIIAAPFAVVGSIGVMAQLPNFHRFLNKHDIDIELHTAGEYKRTLTLFGENTDKARKKFQAELDETHELFKHFITQHRPQVDIEAVATGEHWHATQALSLQLVDDILTSDDFILNKLKNMDVFEISYEEKQKLTEKITKGIVQGLEKSFMKMIS